MICRIKTYIYSLALVLMILLLGGCSSLLSEQERDKKFSEFLARPERYVLFTPASLESEEKLKAFGLENSGERFNRQFHLQAPIIGVIEQFLAATPHLGKVLIVSPEEVRDLPAGLEESVLFFYSDWHLVYRRILPSFSMNQLQVGVVAKVIPLGQVLSGKGPLALRTASWEGTCYFKAFDGEFFDLDDWAADNGARLRQGIDDAQAYCGKKLSFEFSEHLMSRGLFAAP